MTIHNNHCENENIRNYSWHQIFGLNIIYWQCRPINILGFCFVLIFQVLYCFSDIFEDTILKIDIQGKLQALFYRTSRQF